MTTELPLVIDAEETFDVVVVGGGMAAICAAIAAARNGCDTALLEMDQVLGGNSSPLLGVHVSGAHSFHPYASETGIVEEIELEAARQAAKTRSYGSHYSISYQWDLVLQQKLEEAGVRIFRRHQGRRALTDGRRIVGIVVDDAQHFQTKLFHVRHGVIDASGDGTVAASAGAEFMRGTEAKDTFHERSAPVVASDESLGTSLTAVVVKRSAPVEFVLPPQFADRAAADDPYEKLTSHGVWHPEDECCFLWVTESGGERDTILDDAEIRREILYQLYRWWDNVKNFSFSNESRNWELIWVSPKSGKRESRRFVGDLVLNQQDVEHATVFDDSIGYGGYGVDIHEPVGTRAKVIFYSIPPLWNFPYRACYARDFDNLWLAGRLMSVSHLALGTVRLMRTLACIGQGVGTAVALAKAAGCTAREVYEQHREQLQQMLLRQDATILNVTDNDPANLARDAAVSATSEMRHGATHVDRFLALDIPRGVQLWDWAPRLEQVEFYVRNGTDEEHNLTIRLSLFERQQPWKEEREYIRFRHLTTPHLRMEWGSDNSIAGFAPVTTATTAVPPHYAGWVTFTFASPVAMIPVDPSSDENRYNLLIDPCPGVELAGDAHHYDFALRAWQPDGDEYEVDGDCHAFRLTPAPRYGEAANVIDGHHRRYSTNPVHAWLSDFDTALPQSLTLTFPEPRRIATIQLTFDTIDRCYHETPINCDERFSHKCVTDYQVEVKTDAGWEPVVAETGNYLRWRHHSFAPVTAQAVRLTVTGVRDPCYRVRVYEVRVYGPDHGSPFLA